MKKTYFAQAEELLCVVKQRPATEPALEGV